MIFAFSVIAVLFLTLVGRIGWITVIANDEYARRAAESQIRDETLQPRRGAILDRNMTELAASVASYRVWVRPANVAGGEEKESEKAARREKAVKMLSEELDMDAEKVRSLLSQEKALVKAAKDVNKDVVARIRQRCKDEGITGVEVEQDVSRRYSFGAFASHVIGTVNDEGHGRSGLELQYDKLLSGTKGRWIKNTDASGGMLAYGNESRYDEKNGMSLVLTIDEAIQHYAEKVAAETAEKTGAARVTALVLENKTGDVLAMTATPEYDLNDPKAPPTPEEAEYLDSLDAEEKTAYWNRMWRNPMISDTYDPGSVFKLITVSAALEERATYPDEAGFRCTGYYQVGKSSSIRCWRYYNPHGHETLKEAVGNSCNPVMVQLAQRMGADRFYKYLTAFGFTGLTGVDFPSEGRAQLQGREQAGQLGLATMSFGQGLSVTPIQLITAVAAIGNDGKLMRPRLVKGLADESGRMVEEYRPVVERQAISPQTAAEVRDIMEFVVNTNVKGARIPGYRLGGKTGTGEKLINGSYQNGGKVVASMLLMAPMEDPQVTVLLIADEPDPAKGDIHGTTAAAPGARQLMSDILRYLNIQPNYTEQEIEDMGKSQTEAPNLTGLNFSDAAAIIQGEGLTYVVSPVKDVYEDFVVADQYPRAGEKLPPGGQICLYRE
jgi:stage V sporulation protein D (sporulation-specific penicillin-binding protein)